MQPDAGVHHSGGVQAVGAEGSVVAQKVERRQGNGAHHDPFQERVLLCRIFRLLLLPCGEVIGVVGFASVRELAILLSVALVDGLAVGVDVELAGIRP